MKIYFSAAILYKDARGQVYDRIVASIKKHGHTVLSYGINEVSISDILSQSDEARSLHYHKVVRWIAEADLVVIEASFPSTLHIGHEIALAMEKGKPVVVLYEKGNKPFFLSGNDSDRLFLIEYQSNNVEDVVSDAVSYAADQADTRFNFFISPAIGSYLDWISKNKRIPRAVYLRRLIENDMKDNKEYTG